MSDIDARPSVMTGGGSALLAALLFGATTPWLKRAGVGIGPFATAALLYAGASLFALATLSVHRRGAEAPLRARHLPRLLAVAALGAAVAPVAFAWGVAHASGTVASLLLNLEAAFTIALGWALYREHVGLRVAIAAAAIGGGGALLVASRGFAGGIDTPLFAVVLATLAWAADNAVGRPLAELDPAAVVAAKGALGAAMSCALFAAFREPWPGLAAALSLLACGAVGFGASLWFYLRAQRRLGAGRTASVFAMAPFFGAAAAAAIGEPLGGLPTAIAAALMLFGVYLHLREHHEHAHTHEAMEHEHAHRHDDGHHDHTHDVMPVHEHSHTHRHEPQRHAHPHAPDAHHRHKHGGA